MIIVWLVVILILLLISLSILYYHYREVKNINNQLNLILNEYSDNDIRVISDLNYNKELVKTLNQFLLRFNYIKKKYITSDQHNKMMISSIAHDFRTPLTSILGYIQILQETKDEATKQKHLEIIEKRINALSILIEDFYALSLLQSDEYPVNTSNINISLILTEQVALYYQDISNKFDSVKIEIEESSTTIESDSSIIQRIISNLIKNCLVHGEDMCKISYLESDESIDIMISNSVSSKIDTTRIFERTYRHDKSRHLSSTGLGLSIASQLAHMLDYKLSANQNGNTLVFTLNIKKK